MEEGYEQVDKSYVREHQNAWDFNCGKHDHLQRDCDQATKSVRS